MTVSGSIYFFGKYRPAHFEAAGVQLLANKMLKAVVFNMLDRELKRWLINRIREGNEKMQMDDNLTAWSADHCDRGVSYALRPHDPFLDSVTIMLPNCPGLDYSEAVNA